MADETPPPLPPLPDAFTIPFQAIESWLAIPPNEYVEARLTRVDLDHFFASFDKSLRAQHAFQQAMVSYTNGNLEEANHELDKSRRLLIESQNEFRQFFNAIMVSASRGTDGERGK